MPRMTPGYTRNTIRRALRTLVDPEPTGKQLAELWEFFGHACAYCGRSLKKDLREGDVDHLVSAADGGANHITNRVLSCGACNGDEKGDKPWRKFLGEKVKDTSLLAERCSRIEAWISREWSAGPGKFAPQLLERETQRAVSAFDEAIAQLKQARSEA